MPPAHTRRTVLFSAGRLLFVVCEVTLRNFLFFTSCAVQLCPTWGGRSLRNQVLKFIILAVDFACAVLPGAEGSRCVLILVLCAVPGFD